MKSEDFSGLVVKALVARKDWGAEERKLVLECFTAFESIRIKRAAIDGMTAHPHADFVKPLLEYSPKIGAEDLTMKQAAKIALRNCLEAKTDSPYRPSISKETKPSEVRFLFETLLGCTDAQAVGGLVDLLKAKLVPEELAFEAGLRIGRYGDPNRWGTPAADYLDTDYTSLRSLVRSLAGTFRGIQERGYRPGEIGERARAYENFSPFAFQRTRFALLASESLAHEALAVYREARPTIPANRLGTHGEKLFEELFRGRPTPEHIATVAEVVLLYGAKGGRETIGSLLEEAPQDSPLFPRLIPLLLANNPTTADCVRAVQSIKTAPYSVALSLGTALAGDKFGSELLLASIQSGEAPARLLQEKAIVEKLKASKVPDLDAKLKSLTKNLPAPEKRLDDLIKSRRENFPKAKTDVALGKAAFAKNCAICHQLNNEGAKVGPQLDGLGVRGLDRLLEDTLDPNRNVDQAFRATKFDLKDGRSILGLLLREEGAIYVVADTDGKELRMAKADVDRKITQATSAMPANIDALLKEEEYFNLMAFLLEQKPKK